MDLLQKDLKAENRVSKNLEHSVVIVATVSLEQQKNNAAPVQMLDALKDLIQLLRDAMYKLVDQSVVHGLGIGLKANQVLHPSYARELMRIHSEIDFRTLCIAHSQSTVLRAPKLLQHIHTAMIMWIVLQGVQGWIRSSYMLDSDVITTGKHQQCKNKEKSLLQIGDLYLFHSLKQHLSLRTPLMS